MLRKALQGAVVAGAATILAVGSASPAMAQGGYYEYSPSDFGGINVLSNLCVNVQDVVTLVDVLNFNGDAECDLTETDIHANGNEVDLDGGHGGWHGHKKHHGWDD